MFKCDSMDSMDICRNKIIKAKAASTQHITVLLSVADIPGSGSHLVLLLPAHMSINIYSHWLPRVWEKFKVSRVLLPVVTLSCPIRKNRQI